MAVFRPANGLWAINRSSGGANSFTRFGGAQYYDIPVPGDYDGIGRTELAVFRPSTAQFFVLSPSGGRVLGSFGERNLYDIPPQASIVSLRKLGTVGGIRLASVSGGASAPPGWGVVFIAPVTSKKRASQDVVSFALDSLTTGESAPPAEPVV